MSLIDKWREIEVGTRRMIGLIVGYVVWMGIFYAVGATKARLIDFVAVILLTGLYGAIVWFVKNKILDE